MIYRQHLKKVRDIETCILYFQVLLYRHCQPLFPYEWGKMHAVTFCREKLIRKKEALNLFYYALLKYIT